jgi:hypothetical protein
VVLVASLGGLGVLLATAMYGGKLVFEHAAGIPTEVLQAEMHERSEGHHHGAEGEGEPDPEEHEHSAPPAAAMPADSTAPAGHTHAPGTPPHKD